MSHWRSLPGIRRESARTPGWRRWGAGCGSGCQTPACASAPRLSVACGGRGDSRPRLAWGPPGSAETRSEQAGLGSVHCKPETTKI